MGILTPSIGLMTFPQYIYIYIGNNKSLDPRTYQLSFSKQLKKVTQIKCKIGWDLLGPSVDLFASKGNEGEKSKARNCAITSNIYNSAMNLSVSEVKRPQTPTLVKFKPLTNLDFPYCFLLRLQSPPIKKT